MSTTSACGARQAMRRRLMRTCGVLPHGKLRAGLGGFGRRHLLILTGERRRGNWPTFWEADEHGGPTAPDQRVRRVERVRSRTCGGDHLSPDDVQRVSERIRARI